MIVHQAVLHPLGSVKLPANVRNVEVFDGLHRLMGPIADPAYDTCSRQSSFVRDRHHMRIVVEWTRCWGSELDNYTKRRLTVRWESR